MARIMVYWEADLPKSGYVVKRPHNKDQSALEFIMGPTYS